MTIWQWANSLEHEIKWQCQVIRRSRNSNNSLRTELQQTGRKLLWGRKNHTQVAYYKIDGRFQQIKWLLISLSDFEFVLLRFHMAASQQMLLSLLQGRSVDFTTVSLPVYYCGIMSADTRSHLYMYQAICEYSEHGPALVRLYLLNLWFLEKFLVSFFFLSPCKQSSVEAEARLSYPVTYSFAAKVLNIYFIIGLDQLFY